MLEFVGAATVPLPPSSYVSTDGKTKWALESTTLPACCSKYAAAGTQTKWPLVSADMTCSGGLTYTTQEWVEFASRIYAVGNGKHGLCLSTNGIDGFYRIAE